MKSQVKVLVVALVVMLMGALVVPTFAQVRHDINADTVLFYEDGAIEIWTVDADGNALPVIRLSASELEAYAEAPAEHTLVASSGDIALYKLSTGEWQLSSGEAEGKIRTVYFDSGFAYERQAEWNVFDAA